MSTTEVSKVAVVDPRIVQTQPTYAVEKGALSLTNGKFSAIANSASSQTYNVQVPSENVFVDRAVDWSQRVYAVISLTLGVNADANKPLLIPGVHFSLAPFPSHQCVNTMSATINDSTVTINTSDVLPQVLRLSDMASARKQRTCPTKLDQLRVPPQTLGWDQANNQFTLPREVSLSSSSAGYGLSAYATDEVGCGAWSGFRFEPHTAGNAYSLSVVGYEGLPCPVGGADQTFSVNCSWLTTEKLVLPPFIFSDDYELSTGLFGVQNIQLTINMASSPSRAFRINPVSCQGTAYASDPVVTFRTTGTTPFETPLLNVQFLTPPIEVDMPAKSVVPWMEFPRYISPSFTAVAGTSASGLVAGASPFESQTITLPSIPDLLMIYIKPQSYASSLVSDYVLPINKISINFDNFSGLLASHTQEELYKMSVNNGVDMDWASWSGAAWSGSGKKVATVGGPLVLRPGRDFPLQSGQAPGLVGNFTFQFTGTCDNYSTATPTVSVYVVAVNSGFFETIKGSSRIIKGILTETDILGATAVAPSQPLARVVGGAKKMGGMATAGLVKKHSPMSAYC